MGERRVPGRAVVWAEQLRVATDSPFTVRAADVIPAATGRRTGGGRIWRGGHQPFVKDRRFTDLPPGSCHSTTWVGQKPPDS